MSVSVILRCCPILTKEHLLDLGAVRHHEVFRTGSLTPVRQGVDTDGVDQFKPIPICVNHQKNRVIGVVTHLREDDGITTSGPWLYAHARIDTPPEWLSKDTSVSISYKDVRRRAPLPGQEWSIVDQAWLTEISLLSPSRPPAHPAARVTWIGEPEPRRSPAAGRGPSDPSPAAGGAEEGEVIYGGGRIVRTFATSITTRGPRGEVVRHDPDGSQTWWVSEDEYRADSTRV